MKESKSPPPHFSATNMTPNLALFKKSIKKDRYQFKKFKDGITKVATARDKDLQDKISPLQLWCSRHSSKTDYLYFIFGDNLASSIGRVSHCISGAQKLFHDLVEQFYYNYYCWHWSNLNTKLPYWFQTGYRPLKPLTLEFITYWNDMMSALSKVHWRYWLTCGSR